MQRRWVVSAEYRSAIDAIIAARTAQGLTQREVGRRLGMHPSFLNKIENLERRLDILEFIALARAIGLSPEELMGAVAATVPEDMKL